MLNEIEIQNLPIQGENMKTVPNEKMIVRNQHDQ